MTATDEKSKLDYKIASLLCCIEQARVELAKHGPCEALSVCEKALAGEHDSWISKILCEKRQLEDKLISSYQPELEKIANEFSKHGEAYGVLARIQHFEISCGKGIELLRKLFTGTKIDWERVAGESDNDIFDHTKWEYSETTTNPVTLEPGQKAIIITPAKK